MRASVQRRLTLPLASSPLCAASARDKSPPKHIHATRRTRSLGAIFELSSNLANGIVSLGFPVGQRADELPTAIARPDIRKSAGTIDEYRKGLIARDDVLRGGGGRARRPERDFAEERAAVMFACFGGAILPARSFDVDQLQRLAVRIFDVQGKGGSVNGATRLGNGGRRRRLCGACVARGVGVCRGPCWGRSE